MQRLIKKNNIFNSSNNVDLFWQKKAVVSFVLSILVFLLHIHSFDMYEQNSGMPLACLKLLNVVFTRALGVIAVPLFFVMSGALFFRNYSNKVYFKKIQSRTKSLIIPYLFWNTLPLISLFIKFILTGDYKSSFGNTNIFLTIFHYESNFVFWFLFDLIVFVIVSPLIDLLLKNKAVAFLSLTTMIILREFGIQLPESVFFRGDAIIFYFIGCIIGKYYFDSFCKTDYGKRSKTISIIIFVIFTFCSILIEYNHIKVFNTLYTVFLLIYIASFWVISNIVVSKITFYEFYNYSFMIYALHAKIAVKLSEILYGLFPKNNYFSIINFFLTVLITVVLICVISKLIKRYLPTVYKFITGSR